MRVRCIGGPNARFARTMARWGVTPPTVGEVYTVTRSVRPRVKPTQCYYVLKEIKTPMVRYSRSDWQRAGFPAQWFVEEKTTSTSTAQDISLWLSGADPSSEQFDNRRKVPATALEKP